jgi:sugar-phosphatase
MIQAAIFDMDGLLVDSEPFWAQAEMEVFGSVGLQMTPDMPKQTMGLRIDEVVRYWYERHPWKAPSQEDIANALVQRVIGLIVEDGRLLPGAREAIDFFVARQIPLAIASSALTPVIASVVAKFDLADVFQVVYSAEHEPYGKPHPGVFLTTAKKLGVAPRQCVVFEDSPNGVLAAKAAQMVCVAVPNPAWKGSNRFGIADLVLGSLADFGSEQLNRLHANS